MKTKEAVWKLFIGVKRLLNQFDSIVNSPLLRFALFFHDKKTTFI